MKKQNIKKIICTLLVGIISAMAFTLSSADEIQGSVVFAAGDGAEGTMEAETGLLNGSTYKIPGCAFTKAGMLFMHWDASDGNTYVPDQQITLDFTESTELTLTPAWTSTIQAQDGVIDLWMKADETITLKNIPGGSSYRVWEETPKGWQLISQVNPSGTIVPNDLVAATLTNEYVPGTATVSLIAKKTLDGKMPEQGRFEFELLDSTGAVVQRVANSASGVVSFAPLMFHSPGTFVYTIQEVRGEDETIAYDSHQETVTITVEEDEDGNLTAVSAGTSDVPEFRNTTKPGSLTLTKQTAGGGNPEQDFTFEITLENEYGASLDNVVMMKD